VGSLFWSAPAFGAPRGHAAQTSQSTQSQSSAPVQVSGVELEEARRLLQQGKFDEAIVRLHQQESAHPGMKGISHALGTAYYKKSVYVNAIASLKKALEDNPKDSEAEQLLELSYYLSQRPADA